MSTSLHFRIVNGASNSNLGADNVGDPIFAGSISETPDDHEQWRVNTNPQAPNIISVTNVGLNANVTLDLQGNTVITSTEGTNFLIYPVGDPSVATDPVQIQTPDNNLIWTVGPPVVPNGVVTLAPQSGAIYGEWRILPVT